MSPLTSPRVEAAIDSVRGRMRQATLFTAEGEEALEPIGLFAPRVVGAQTGLG